MAARAAFIAVSAAWLALTLLGCSDEHAATGVRLTIRYLEAPALLHISGTTEDGRFFGPTIVPDPRRALAPSGETVLLALPEEMDGSVLTLAVIGLNDRRSAQMRGVVRTEIVRHSVQTAFVSLANDATSSDIDGGVDEEMGEPIIPPPFVDSGSDASVGPIVDDDDDDAPVIVDSGTPAQPDATLQEPEPMPDPSMPTPCAGLACATPMQCASEGACDVKCPGGELCAIQCGAATDCKPSCKNSTCSVACDTSAHCHPTCEGHADCEITCAGGEACRDITCKDDARCLLRCESADCDMRCQREMDRKVCADGVIVCNRGCPEGAGP